MKSEEIAKGKKITKPEPIKTNSDKIKSGMKWGEFFLASVGFIFFRIIVPLLWGLGSMVRAFWKWLWRFSGKPEWIKTGKKKRSRRVYKG